MNELRGLASEHTAKIAELAGKFLTFRLAEEEYGLEIMKVQEIIGIMQVTKVPRVPEYVRGVINLRGKIIPTIDLRTKFGFERADDTDKTCIIVVELESAKGKLNMGIIVDEVAEVMDFKSEEIDSAPDFGNNMDTAFILGIGIVKSGVKILLNLDKVLTTQELVEMEDLTEH